MTTALARFSTVRELVAVFAQAEADVRAAFAQIVGAQKRVNQVFTLGGNLPIRVEPSRHGYHADFDDADVAIIRMRRDAWTIIVARLELRKMMSIVRFNQLEHQIEKEDPPEITEENVLAFVDQHACSLQTMIKEAVAEVFEWLRPHHSEYKSNSELEIGPRVVLPWMVEKEWSGVGFRVNYGRQQHLIALENVFRTLDGSGACAKGHYSDLENAIRATKNGRGETQFFAFRCFANKNLHLRFRRLDLLDKLNQIGGGLGLRPAR